MPNALWKKRQTLPAQFLWMTAALCIAFRTHNRRLEELWLNDNPLRSLPPEIQKCLSLRHLQLQVRAGCPLSRAQGRNAALFSETTA